MRHDAVRACRMISASIRWKHFWVDGIWNSNAWVRPTSSCRNSGLCCLLLGWYEMCFRFALHLATAHQRGGQENHPRRFSLGIGWNLKWNELGCVQCQLKSTFQWFLRYGDGKDWDLRSWFLDTSRQWVLTWAPPTLIAHLLIDIIMEKLGCAWCPVKHALLMVVYCWNMMKSNCTLGIIRRIKSTGFRSDTFWLLGSEAVQLGCVRRQVTHSISDGSF